MKVVIAMDSFKGNLSSLDAGEAVRTGLLRAIPNTVTVVRPLADGGEGTVDALIAGMGGRTRTVIVSGPLAENGQTVKASYGILPDRITAVMEMSSAAGLTLVPPDRRNPLLTTTRGVGELIADAVQHGCRRFLIGIGGSATNDGGIGMLQALGYGMLDRNGRQVSCGAKGLKELEAISDRGVLPALQDCQFQIACDVTNPLCGSNGASAIFGPQKGASPAMIARMDAWLAHYAALSRRSYPRADDAAPGSGAAGGLGFAFLTYTHAVLRSGVDMILEETGLAREVESADLVVTGEGRLDSQTAMGKAPIGVAKLAKQVHKPVIAFAGCVTEDAGLLNRSGIDAFFPILRSAVPLSEAMEPDRARANLSAAAEQVFRLWNVAQKNEIHSGIDDTAGIKAEKGMKA